MKTVKNFSVVLISALLTVVGGSTGIGMISAQTVSPPKVSRDVQVVPHVPQVIISAVSASDPAFQSTADTALAAAKKEFGIRDNEIDYSAGIVKASITIAGDQRHRNERSWIVIVNRTTPSFAPGTQNGAFRKLCIVVDAVTGQYEYAYTADLEGSVGLTPAVGPLKGSRVHTG